MRFWGGRRKFEVGGSRLEWRVARCGRPDPPVRDGGYDGPLECRKDAGKSDKHIGLSLPSAWMIESGWTGRPPRWCVLFQAGGDEFEGEFYGFFNDGGNEADAEQDGP